MISPDVKTIRVYLSFISKSALTRQLLSILNYCESLSPAVYINLRSQVGYRLPIPSRVLDEHLPYDDCIESIILY